jgi:uncharacterized protein YndB with AHSA1/START domain
MIPALPRGLDGTNFSNGRRATSRLHIGAAGVRYATRRLHFIMSSTDRIEKHIVIKGTQSRVWRAITDAKEFGTWFRVAIDSDFAPGTTVRGRITHPGYEHLKMEMQIDRIEPERYFSYRWHPYAIDPKIDYSSETPTLVEFTLAAVEGGTKVTIVESGFDRVPLARRAEAFRMNEGGWAAQCENLRAHVEAT